MAMSPHYFNTRRNMQNYGLAVLPDAKIRFRLGYSPNTNVGPSYTTLPQGAEQFLLQDLSSGISQYRFAVDFRFMKMSWGVNPNHLGHNDFPGCFRCHDGSHTSADGRTISNDCTACHNLLAVQDEHPKIPSDLGLR